MISSRRSAFSSAKMPRLAVAVLGMAGSPGRGLLPSWFPGAAGVNRPRAAARHTLPGCDRDASRGSGPRAVLRRDRPGRGGRVRAVEVVLVVAGGGPVRAAGAG